MSDADGRTVGSYGTNFFAFGQGRRIRWVGGKVFSDPERETMREREDEGERESELSQSVAQAQLARQRQPRFLSPASPLHGHWHVHFWQLLSRQRDLGVCSVSR